jgi:hypothetical protein
MNPLGWPAAAKVAVLAVVAACIGGGAALATGNGYAAPASASAGCTADRATRRGTPDQSSCARLAGAARPSPAAASPSPRASFPSPASVPSPTDGPYSGNPASGDCLLGANEADVEVGIADPTSSCASWIQSLAGSGLVWYPITTMLAPGSHGNDGDTMGMSCDLTDGAQELYVVDGGEYYGNSICSQEEQNGWTPEGSPGPLAAQGQQQQQAAVSASAAAAQDSANAAAEQQAQSDISALEGFSLSNDLSALSGDVRQTDADLGTVKSDAASGQGSYCGNVSTAGGDADTVAGDADTLSGDLDTLTNDIGTEQQDITGAQNDLAALQSDGLPDPPGSASAIASAQAAISQAVSAANADIATVNGYVNDAYSIANGMATGSCEGSGPGSPPSPIADVSA